MIVLLINIVWYRHVESLKTQTQRRSNNMYASLDDFPIETSI